MEAHISLRSVFRNVLWLMRSMVSASTAQTLSALSAVHSSKGHRLPTREHHPTHSTLLHVGFVQIAVLFWPWKGNILNALSSFLSAWRVVCFSCALRFCTEIENSKYEMKSNIPAWSYWPLLRVQVKAVRGHEMRQRIVAKYLWLKDSYEELNRMLTNAKNHTRSTFSVRE